RTPRRSWRRSRSRCSSATSRRSSRSPPRTIPRRSSRYRSTCCGRSSNVAAPSAMRLAELDYPLPEELIAQEPAPERDAARLLVADRGQPARHAHVRDLPALLRAGDLLVLNDTRVIAARVRGRRPSGGRLELLFVRPCADGAWEVLVRGGPRAGEPVHLPGATGTW